MSTSTSAGGAFRFAALAPGMYRAVASHSEWTIENHTVEFELGWGNLQLEQQFTVTGYDVRGRVRASGESIVGVGLLLYSADPTPPVLQCTQELKVLWSESRLAHRAGRR